jgi:hypothetical protein
MKKIIILSSLILSVLSCDRKIGSCSPPLTFYENSNNKNDLYNSIDWDNFNNVWDVYANNNFKCSDPRVTQNDGRSIKVYGWLMIESNKIRITNDSIYAISVEREFEGWCSSWSISINCTDEIQRAIAVTDLTRKCYLKGELKLEKFMDGDGAFCCQMRAYIVLKDINDIYFE